MTTRTHSEVELAHRLGLPTVAALNRAIRAGQVPAHDETLPVVGRVWHAVPDERAEFMRWKAGQRDTSSDRLRQRAEAL